MNKVEIYINGFKNGEFQMTDGTIETMFEVIDDLLGMQEDEEE